MDVVTESRTSIEELAAAAEGLVLAGEGDQLRAAFAVLDRLAATISSAIGDFDASEGWDFDGAASLTSWLRQHGRMANGDAHRWACTARRLRSLPETRGAWESGVLSGGQVQAIMANLRERTLGRFAEHEASLVPLLAVLPVGDVATAMQTWAARAEALDDGPEPKAPQRELHLSKTLRGRWELKGSFEGEQGAVIAAAIRRAQTGDVDGEPARVPAERRADSLADVCRLYLDSQPATEGKRNRPHLNVVIDLNDYDPDIGGAWGRADDGTLLDPVAVARLLCDSTLARIILRGPSTVLDHGRAVRTATTAQFNALVVRDRRCRFGDCDRPPAWCEAHHINPYDLGGLTNLDELILGCSRHHHIWHRPGWSVKRLPDGTVETTAPDGQTYISPPPPSARPPP